MNFVKMRLSRAQDSLRFFTASVLILNVTAAVATELYTYNPGAGKTNYMLQCQGCHKANGEGIEGRIPDLTEHGVEMVSSERGRQFYVAVPGSSQSPLSDRRLADVLNYISINILEPSNTKRKVKLFETSEVIKYRSVKMRNVAKERAEIVNDIEHKAQ